MTRVKAADTTADEVVAGLDEDGYCIVEGLLDEHEVAAARSELKKVLEDTPTGRNPFEGFKTRRIYALFAKTRTLDNAATNPLVLAMLDQVLGHYQLSAPVGIEIGPGEKAQSLHRDEGVYPLPKPHPTVVVNTMWPLDDFTEANGATRLIPGSHKWDEGQVPSEEPTVCATMRAGSMMAYLGNVVHGGGANSSAEPRLGVIIEYVVSWLRPQETQLLAVPPDIVRGLSPRLQELVGYNIYPPFLGYVDGRHPRKVLEPS